MRRLVRYKPSRLQITRFLCWHSREERLREGKLKGGEDKKERRTWEGEKETR